MLHVGGFAVRPVVMPATIAWAGRVLLGGLLIVLVGSIVTGCAHQTRGKVTSARQPTPADPCLNAGCDRPLAGLLALLGPCEDLQSLQEGLPFVLERPITLKECIDAALCNGRVGEDSYRVKTAEASIELTKAAGQGREERLTREGVWLSLEVGTQDLVLAVTTAYWRLVLARGTVISREETLRALDREAQNVQARFKEKLLTRQDVDSLEEQRHLTRAEWLTALTGLREAESNLRRTAGLLPNDGTTLIPCDPAVMTPPAGNPYEDLLQARECRPELALARLKAELACQALEQAKEEEKALARCQVEREQAAHRDAEEVMVFDLLRSGFQQRQAWLSLEALTAREQAAGRRLAAVTEKWQSKEFGELRELIQAQTGFSTARRDALEAATQYQVALAEHLRRKGLLLQHYCVCIPHREPRPVPGG